MSEEDYKTAYETVLEANKTYYKEIERLNKQIEEYQKALDETTSEKIDLENIIKEVREYIEDDRLYMSNGDALSIANTGCGKKILEILDKENKND